MVLYSESKLSSDLLKKQSTLDQDFQNPNNQLKFSIASLLFKEIPNSNNNVKKPITSDYYSKLNKYQDHHSENNNCLDLSCLTCKSSFKNWINLYNLQKQQNNASFNFNNKLRETIFNQPATQITNHTFNQQQITSSINPNHPQINNASSLIQNTTIQQLTNQTNLNTLSSTTTNSNLHNLNNKQKLNFNQTSAQQLTNYINSLNNLNTGNAAGGKMTQSLANKKKRNRTIFSNDQLERLEKEFERTQYMVGHERLSLAAELDLNEVQVKVWFQNRRIKFRRDGSHKNKDQAMIL